MKVGDLVSLNYRVKTPKKFALVIAVSKCFGSDPVADNEITIMLPSGKIRKYRKSSLRVLA
jgi:hypothetical protein